MHDGNREPDAEQRADDETHEGRRERHPGVEQQVARIEHHAIRRLAEQARADGGIVELEHDLMRRGQNRPFKPQATR